MVILLGYVCSEGGIAGKMRFSLVKLIFKYPQNIQVVENTDQKPQIKGKATKTLIEKSFIERWRLELQE